MKLVSLFLLRQLKTSNRDATGASTTYDHTKNEKYAWMERMRGCKDGEYEFEKNRLMMGECGHRP
jgi:hypothetical protein